MLALGSADYIGIAGVITAFFGGLASLVAAVTATRASRNTTTMNGKSLGELAENVAAAVTTPPGAPALGELAAVNADAVEEVHAVVTGSTGQHPVVKLDPK